MFRVSEAWRAHVQTVVSILFDIFSKTCDGRILPAHTGISWKALEILSKLLFVRLSSHSRIKIKSSAYRCPQWRRACPLRKISWSWLDYPVFTKQPVSLEKENPKKVAQVWSTDFESWPLSWPALIVMWMHVLKSSMHCVFLSLTQPLASSVKMTNLYLVDKGVGGSTWCFVNLDSVQASPASWLSRSVNTGLGVLAQK